MKVTGLKYNLFVVILSALFAMLDIFLMINYRFGSQLLIFTYVMVGVVPLCGIISICAGISPTLMISKETATIKTLSIPDERYKIHKNAHNTEAVICFDEIDNCIIEDNKLIIKLRYGHEKTLYLGAFTKSQIIKIKSEIDKIIK